MKRFFKAVTPLIAVFALTSSLMVVSAHADENKNGGDRAVANPYQGTYMSLEHNRSAGSYFASGATKNKTSVNRTGSVYLSGYTQTGSWVDSKGNSAVLAQNQTVHTDKSFSSQAYYIYISGTLYNAVNPIAGTLEWGEIQTDYYGTHSISHPY